MRVRLMLATATLLVAGLLAGAGVATAQSAETASIRVFYADPAGAQYDLYIDEAILAARFRPGQEYPDDPAGDDGLLVLPGITVAVDLRDPQTSATIVTVNIATADEVAYTVTVEPGPSLVVTQAPRGGGPAPTPGPTATATPTPTATATPTPTATATPTPTATATPTPEPTAPATPTPAPSPSASPSPTPRPTVTASPTPTPRPTATASATPRPTPSRAETVTVPSRIETGAGGTAGSGAVLPAGAIALLAAAVTVIVRRRTA